MALSEHLAAMGGNVQRGDTVASVVTARRMNAIMEAIRALARGENLVSGPGVSMNRNSTGVVIKSTARNTPGASITHPFQISASINGSNEAVIRVRYGTINDIAPVDVATDITRTSAGTYNIYLQNLLNLAGAITASYVVATTSTYTQFDYESVILLGTVVVVNTSGDLSIGAVNQAATHSLRFLACDREVSGASLVARGIYEYWGF